MKHPHLQMALRAALLVIGVRLALFYGNFQTGWSEPAYWFLNLAMLPALCIYAIWPRNGYRGFLLDAKISMQILGIYSLLMAALFYVYYSAVDTEFMASRTENFIFQTLEASGDDVDPEEVGRRARSMFTMRNGTAVALTGYILLSAFYAIFFSAIKRLVLFGKNT